MNQQRMRKQGRKGNLAIREERRELGWMKDYDRDFTCDTEKIPERKAKCRLHTVGSTLLARRRGKLCFFKL
jgi:hypothetical protein